jgi:glutamine amidotransferase
MIGIVDYGLGNIKAFANIYHAANIKFVIARAPQDLQGVTRVILPGVGAFDQAMERLESSGMREVLDEMVLGRGVPVVGVCVGLQILMRSSEEGTRPGLGWIEGDVVRFQRPPENPRLCIPHMGWNSVTPVPGSPLFQGLDATAHFYFLHSYYVRCQNAADELASTDYAGRFSCAVRRGNIHGVQFHPEKSHHSGIQLLKNFAVI